MECFFYSILSFIYRFTYICTVNARYILIYIGNWKRWLYLKNAYRWQKERETCYVNAIIFNKSKPNLWMDTTQIKFQCYWTSIIKKRFNAHALMIKNKFANSFEEHEARQALHSTKKQG